MTRARHNTYIPTWEGWLYLAAVLDCCTKKVLGRAMAEHMRTSLVTDALAMAARNITIHRDVTIFHSDYAEVCVKPENSDFACAA